MDNMFHKKGWKRKNSDTKNDSDVLKLGSDQKNSEPCNNAEVTEVIKYVSIVNPLELANEARCAFSIALQYAAGNELYELYEKTQSIDCLNQYYPNFLISSVQDGAIVPGDVSGIEGVNDGCNIAIGPLQRSIKRVAEELTPEWLNAYKDLYSSSEFKSYCYNNTETVDEWNLSNSDERAYCSDEFFDFVANALWA